MSKLEVCCYSVDCALTAELAGADRIELCAGQREGGLTPSYGVLAEARKQGAAAGSSYCTPARRGFLLQRQELCSFLVYGVSGRVAYPAD